MERGKALSRPNLFSLIELSQGPVREENLGYTEGFGDPLGIELYPPPRASSFLFSPVLGRLAGPLN